VGVAVFAPITHQIIGCAIRVHSKVGPGLLEHVYQSCLGLELQKAGLRFDLEVPLPVVYDGTQIACAYRADFLVEREVLVELKCVERLAPIHEAQTLTYLHLSEASHALLINFNVRRLKDGIRSFVRKRP
jgi:GxxExxY protein